VIWCAPLPPHFPTRNHMAFDWLTPSVRRRPQRRDAMYRKEIEERAAMLHRLGYGKEEARRRIQANLEWDFEVGAGDPAVREREIAEILDRTWNRGGAGGGLPTL
jgi:hypothetical protein